MPAAVMTDDKILTVAEIAERLRVTERVVRDWLASGQLRGYRLGGKRVGWRVREDDLIRFMDASANRPSDDG